MQKILIELNKKISQNLKDKLNEQESIDENTQFINWLTEEKGK
jgi:hypothetical protein